MAFLDACIYKNREVLYLLDGGSPVLWLKLKKCIDIVNILEYIIYEHKDKRTCG